MNTARLLKLAPTMIMAITMGYSAYSINPQTPIISTSPTSAPAGDRPVPGASKARAPIATGSRRGRNPFVMLTRPGQGNKTGTELAAGREPRVDFNLSLVQGLTLNATFVQGKTQYASIDGILYERGQHLKSPSDQRSSLVVAQVTSNEVVLEANGSRYRLGYPNQFRPLADRPRAVAGTGRRESRAASTPQYQALRRPLP